MPSSTSGTRSERWGAGRAIQACDCRPRQKSERCKLAGLRMRIVAVKTRSKDGESAVCSQTARLSFGVAGEQSAERVRLKTRLEPELSTKPELGASFLPLRSSNPMTTIAHLRAFEGHVPLQASAQQHSSADDMLLSILVMLVSRAETSFIGVYTIFNRVRRCCSPSRHGYTPSRHVSPSITADPRSWRRVCGTRSRGRMTLSGSCSCGLQNDSRAARALGSCPRNGGMMEAKRE